MDRRPVIAGNWKMHKDHLEAIQLVQRLAYLLEESDYEGQDVVVCPSSVSYTHLTLPTSYSV